MKLRWNVTILIPLTLLAAAGSLAGADEGRLVNNGGFTNSAGGITTGIFEQEPDFPPPDFDPPDVLKAPVHVLLGRGRTGINVQWHDGTDLEDGYYILRRESDGPYEEIASLGPLDGFNSYFDSEIQPETLYCYRVKVTGGGDSKQSLQQCVYTRADYSRPVHRVQLEITTAGFSSARTGDRVEARLNAHPVATFQPKNNVTVIDHSANDFLPGSTHAYDLIPVRDMEDLVLLSIRKEGTDGLCLAGVRLIVNRTDQDPGITVFERTFGNTQQTCRWIDGDDGHSPVLSFSFDELRASPTWPGPTDSWCHPDPAVCYLGMFPMSLETMRDRLEGTLGHFLSLSDNVTWRDVDDDVSPLYSGIQLDVLDEKTVELRLRLKGEVDNFFDPDALVGADVRLVTRQIEDGSMVDLNLTNPYANIEFDVGDVLVCGLFGTPVGCIALLEAIEIYAENAIEDRVALLGTSFRTGGYGICSSLFLEGNTINLRAVDCFDFDADGMPNEWELEHGFDPDDPRDADQDADADGISNLGEYQAGSNPHCIWGNNHANYCRDCGPCLAGMADCDSDAECAGGLVCSHNVGASYGLPAAYDVCECPWYENHPNYCRDCGPCGNRVGDCDNDSECAPGNTCSHNVGAKYGLPANYDVCECALAPGHPDYCKLCGPCEAGEGDCDGDAECVGDRICAEDVGSGQGFAAEIDVCRCPNPLVACFDPPDEITP